MKLLLEKNITVDKWDISSWETASDEGRKNILHRILEDSSNPGLVDIEDALFEVFRVVGIDPHDNPYLDFIDNLSFIPTKSQSKNFRELLTQRLKGNVSYEMDEDFLQNESLFNRSLEDFIYTISAFKTLSDRNFVKKVYGDNISKIDIKEFYNGKNIKPSGYDEKNPKDTSTIKGVIFNWNQYEQEQENTKLVSLTQAFKDYGVSKDRYTDTAIDWLYQSFDDTYDLTDVKYDRDTYIDYLGIILDFDDVKEIPQSYYKKIPKNLFFYDLSSIPSSMEREGTIAYVNELEHSSTPNNLFQDFVIYFGGKWIPYEEYKVVSDSMNKYKNQLLDTKVIKNLSSKASIAAGIITILNDIIPNLTL